MKRFFVNVGFVVVLALALVPLAGVASAQEQGTTLAEGFNGPMGVLVDPDGNVWVIDSGVGGEEEVSAVNPETGEEIAAPFGQTSRIVRVAPDGTQTEVATLPSMASGQEILGGARLALLDGTLYATSGGWVGSAGDEVPENMGTVVRIEDGEVTTLADLWAYESDQNPDGFIYESHPYGLAAGPDGNLWVADAGANVLYSVDPASGSIEVVTVFEAGVESPLPNPNRGGAMESDPVPTGVTFDAAGNAYVAFLPGFPFLPGSAKVVQVSADGQVSDYATGLTSLTDLQTGPDGEMYAVQFAQFGEQGPAPNSGAIVRVREGDASEVLVSGLSFPTAIGFAPNGDAYVTINGVGAPGSGAVVEFAGLTGLAAAAQTETQQAAAQTESQAAAQPQQLPETGGESLPIGWLAAGAGLVLAAAGLLLARRAEPVVVRDE